MKTIRKGLGRGKGKGYYNLVQRDPYIHSLSAKGISIRKFATSPKEYYVRKQLSPSHIKITYPFSSKKEAKDWNKPNIKIETSFQFTPEELRVLKNLNYEYYSSQNKWGLKRTRQPSELFVVETQLGISSKQAKDLVMRYLDVLEKYPEKEVLEFMGYKMNAKGKTIQVGDYVVTESSTIPYEGEVVRFDGNHAIIKKGNLEFRIPTYLLKKKLDAKYCNIASHLKHSKLPDSKFDKEQLRKGIKVELEHTNSRKVAKAIAKAHLVENPKYYDYLEKMEKQLQKIEKQITKTEKAHEDKFQWAL